MFSPVWSGCSPSLSHGHFGAGLLWDGWYGVLPPPERGRGRWGGLSTWPDGHGSPLTAWSIQPTFWDLVGLQFLGVEPPCAAGRSLGLPSGRHQSRSTWPELWLCPDLHQFLPFFTLAWWWGFLKCSLLTELPCSFESQLWLIISKPAEELEVTSPWGGTGESSGDSFLVDLAGSC